MTTQWFDDSPFITPRTKRSTRDLPREYLKSPNPFFCADENLEKENNSAKLTFLEETGKSVTVWRALLDEENTNCLDLESYKEKMGGVVVVLLCHGGYFAGGVFENHKCVVHKTFRRYVTRQGQGQRQMNFDKTTKGGGKSAGKQLRRYNEGKHREETQQILQTWQEYISRASYIFLHAPGVNKTMFFPSQPHQPQQHDQRIKSVPMTTSRPTFAEVTRVFLHLSSLETNQVAPQNLPLALQLIALSREKEKEREREREWEREIEMRMLGGVGGGGGGEDCDAETEGEEVGGGGRGGGGEGGCWGVLLKEGVF